ncbi:MAG: ATP-binding protein [Vicinamibacterales bacterium]
MSTATAFAQPAGDVAQQPTPPPPPATIAETGLHPDSLAQLLLKTLVAGEGAGTALAEKLRLPYAVLDALVQHARVEKLLEVRGASGTGTAAYRYALTDLGRDRAMQFMDVSRYVGPAPVPLAQYTAYVRACMAARPYVDRDRLATGFDQLIVNKAMFDQLGPAVNSGKSLFLYGAPGNGKTVVAEGIGRALGMEMFVPHAIDVDGQVITIFDPVSHVPLGSTTAATSVIAAAVHDRRWEKVKRPVVVVGGELTLEMLDLTFNPIAKFYEAPIQMKANGGVFVVDDFGRQRIPPRDLLNRWIVPLESRVDFLTLHTGRKFEIPFNVLIVFATNLKPESLADEAFLRRIPYKILAKNPTIDEYCRIFELNCRKRQLAFDPVMVEYLHRKYYQPRKLQMRACHPRDLVEQVVNICRYQNREPVITRDLLDAACGSYFLEESDSQGAEG